MIVSFKDRITEKIWNGVRVKLDGNVQQRALLKLRYIHVAQDLEDLTTPPGNKLEPLKGKRKGQHSIRVNQQYRICFIWTSLGAENVEFTDYH